MARGLDRKGGNKTKGKSIISGGIVNELELIPDDLADGEEIREEMEKSPCTEKTNEPQYRQMIYHNRLKICLTWSHATRGGR